jgi:hypothetical protein
MQTIQIIMQRMMWASCFCLALTLYHLPTRALPIKLGEATQLNSGTGNKTTDLPQRLGTEVGGMVEFQSAYVLTRALTQGCQEHHCTPIRIKQLMLKSSSQPSREKFNPSFIQSTQPQSREAKQSIN